MWIFWRLDDLTSCYFSYLRIYKNKDYITTENWNFLYSLEVLRHQYEELWIVTNILSQNKNLRRILGFYLRARGVVSQVFAIPQSKLLDEVQLDFNSVHSIMNTIYQEKTTSKMHLIQKLQHNANGRYYGPFHGLKRLNILV